MRCCARACLRRLGYPRVPIVPDVDGAPGWPAGVRGSMTHCAGYTAAAVGPARRIAAIGIDAEPDAPLPEGVLHLVSTARERDRLTQLPAGPGDPCWDRLLFSAKESVYKAWAPLAGRWIDPQDSEILFEPPLGAFTAELTSDGLVVDAHPVTRLHGRWARDQGILLTAVVMPLPDDGRRST